MSSPVCELCARPVDGTAYACSPCAEKAGKDLASIADVTADARAVAAGQGRRGPAIGGTGAVRLELDLTATAKLDAVTNEITTWARHVAEERGLTIAASGDPLARTAAWLKGQVEYLRHRQEATEAFRDIAAAARILTSLLDGPGERRWLGQCGADTPEGRCPTDLYARPSADYATCRTCEARHEVRQRRAWLDDTVRGYAYTATEISQAYDIPAGTIRVWAHRGRITASGEVDGRPVYPLGAVLDLAAQEAARRETLATRRRASVEAA